MTTSAIIKRLKERLRHNEAWLRQDVSTRYAALKLSYGNTITSDLLDGHYRAVTEENKFLRALLEDAK